MSCPSTSPDLNPIENICDIIYDRLETMRPRNLKELDSRCLNKYGTISLKKLVKN